MIPKRDFEELIKNLIGQLHNNGYDVLELSFSLLGYGVYPITIKVHPHPSGPDPDTSYHLGDNRYVEAIIKYNVDIEIGNGKFRATDPFTLVFDP